MLNEPGGYVYFLLSPREERVKIGWSRDPDDRFKTLKTGSAKAVLKLAVLHGDMAQEKALHTRFARERRNGEWFHFSKRLREYVATQTLDWPAWSAAEDRPAFELSAQRPTVPEQGKKHPQAPRERPVVKRPAARPKPQYHELKQLRNSLSAIHYLGGRRVSQMSRADLELIVRAARSVAASGLSLLKRYVDEDETAYLLPREVEPDGPIRGIRKLA